MRAPRQPDTRLVVCLGLASLLVNLLVLAWLGIGLGADLIRYIDSAAELAAGQPMAAPNAMQYLGYVVVVAVARGAGLGLAASSPYSSASRRSRRSRSSILDASSRVERQA